MSLTQKQKSILICLINMFFTYRSCEILKSIFEDISLLAPRNRYSEIPLSSEEIFMKIDFKISQDL